jgi:1-deoxyxylulose-5-phosphate synthase
VSKLDRRSFLQSAGLAGLGLSVGLHAQAKAPLPKRALQATDQVMLGKTGIKTSRVAMGSGTSGWMKQSDQTRMGPHQFTDLLKYGYDQGITFWEAADQYGSHPYMANGLKTVPREKLAILTKTNSRNFEDVTKDLDRFRKELNTDYIDMVLLHALVDPNWTRTMQGAMDALSEAKRKGIIRAHGVSCHSLGALRAAAASPWVEVDLARINPGGHHMDDTPEVVLSVLRQMKASGKAVLGMKIFGQGKLSPEPDKALRYASRLDCLDAFTIGFMDNGQVDNVVKLLPEVSA